MNAPSLVYNYDYQEPSSRFKGVAMVLLVHVLIGYALVSGMARKGLELIKKPLEAAVIQEVIIPPPPPPPPPPKKIETPKEQPKPEAPPPPFVPPPDEVTAAAATAPAIVSTATPPPTPAVIAPPPLPVPAPVAPPKPSRTDIAIACPTQVPPEMPRKALQEGASGVVKAQARIVNGAVTEVTILSGPRVFHAAVREAMMQYKCTQDAHEVLAVQEFNFKIE